MAAPLTLSPPPSALDVPFEAWEPKDQLPPLHSYTAHYPGPCLY